MPQVENGGRLDVRWRSPSGRRSPFIAVSAIALLLLFVVLTRGCNCVGLPDGTANDDTTDDDTTDDDDDDSADVPRAHRNLAAAPSILMSREFGALGGHFSTNGDVNADGRADLVVSAANLALEGEARGMVYIVTEPVYGSVYADEAATAMIRGTIDWQDLHSAGQRRDLSLIS